LLLSKVRFDEQMNEVATTAGCMPGSLKLIVLTHGDFDHTGNAAYLRHKYAIKIAMHFDDSGMLERGDMFWNRKKGNMLIGMLVPILFGFTKSDRSTPDLPLPGQSKGSIGILTADGDLFCGNLLIHMDKPVLNDILDDSAAANASVERLKSLEIDTVCPGHGKPFPMEQFITNN
jgi:hydroxyacylglutathione hydrolase